MWILRSDCNSNSNAANRLPRKRRGIDCGVWIIGLKVVVVVGIPVIDPLHPSHAATRIRARARFFAAALYLTPYSTDAALMAQLSPAQLPPHTTILHPSISPAFPLPAFHSTKPREHLVPVAAELWCGVVWYSMIHQSFLPILVSEVNDEGHMHGWTDRQRVWR
jgi:hypothetical protein